MLLRDILDGTLNIELMLITDDANISGFYVLKEILKGFNTRNCNIHYFSYEKSTVPYIENNCDITLYDCFSQNCSWFNVEAPSSETVHSLAETLLKNVPSNQQVFVIDSASYLLTIDGIDGLSKTISKLSSIKYKSGAPVFPVIMILHDFNEDSKIHRQLEYMSNVVMKVYKNGMHDELIMSLDHKKNSGKLISENYSCTVGSESGRFTYYEDRSLSMQQLQEPEETNIAELTTFKLTLEDREIESRNKLVLPYMRRQEEKGKIFYEPDENDDWDDEDPDDDLEI